MKKIISLLLTVLMALSLITVAASVSAETVTGKVYFVEPSQWTAGTVFCHIYNSESSFFDWQQRAEKCTYEGDHKWSYDLSKLIDSYIPGGLEQGKDYMIVFSDNRYNETSSIMFNSSCIGDTARPITLNPIFENPFDSRKHSYEISWVNNADKYGAPLQITSVGTVQGKFISKGTTTADLINQWDKDYPDYPNASEYSLQSAASDHKTRLEELKKLLSDMAKNGEILYAGGGVYKDTVVESKPVPHPALVLSKKTGTVYLKGTIKTPYVVHEPYGNTTFSSSNPKIAKVNAKGVITGMKAGKAVITVKHYKSSVKFTVTVKKPTLNKKSVTLKKGRSTTLKINGKVGKATFKTSNKKVATVSAKGVIKAKKKGATTITVKTNGITLKCKVNVK